MKNIFTGLAFCSLALMSFSTSDVNADGYEVGDTAIDFDLKNVDGQNVSMADYTDAKGFLVIFTCNTCPYAKMYEERIKQLHAKYEPQGFPVIAINPNDPDKSPGDSFDEMKKRVGEKDINYAYVYDETQEVAKAYGATRTPHIYVLDKEDSELKVAYIGAIDDNYRDASSVTKTYVEDAIDALLDNKEISTTSTKAIGCTIKWKES